MDYLRLERSNSQYAKLCLIPCKSRMRSFMTAWSNSRTLKYCMSGTRNTPVPDMPHRFWHSCRSGFREVESTWSWGIHDLEVTFHTIADQVGWQGGQRCQHDHGEDQPYASKQGEKFLEGQVPNTKSSLCSSLTKIIIIIIIYCCALTRYVGFYDHSVTIVIYTCVIVLSKHKNTQIIMYFNWIVWNFVSLYMN